MLIEHDLDKCAALWQKFSPEQHLWELWEVNLCLYQPERDKFVFMYTDDSLLPLIYNRDKNRHQLMGDGYAENQSFWIKENEIKLFFEQLPSNTKLFDMNATSVERVLSKQPSIVFKQDYFRYFIRESVEDYLKRLSKSRRQRLRNFNKKFSELSFQIQDEGLEYCINLNTARFGEESDFQDPYYVKAWHKLSKLPYIKFLIAQKNNQIVSCTIIGIYKDVLYILIPGYDTTISDLGNYVIWECIQLKDQLNLPEIDFMAGANDWKASWHFSTEKYYSFEN